MGSLQLVRYLLVGLGVFVFEAEVLQLALDAVQSQSVGKRSIDVERLSGNLVLLVGKHRTEGAHVVQPVGHFDEDDADVLAHGEQQFLEVFGLTRGSVAEDTSRNLCQSVNNLGNLGAKDVGDVLHRVVGVLHHIVQQGRADGGGAEPYLLTHDLCHGQRVHDVRLSRASAHSLVGLLGKVECFGYDFDFLPMLGGQIGVEQLLESVVHHFFFFQFLLFMLLIHNES